MGGGRIHVQEIAIEIMDTDQAKTALDHVTIAPFSLPQRSAGIVAFLRFSFFTPPARFFLGFVLGLPRPELLELGAHSLKLRTQLLLGFSGVVHKINYTKSSLKVAFWTADKALKYFS